MNKLSAARHAAIVRALIEGNSIRATCRLTGADKNTVTKLLVELGTACSDYQGGVLRDLPCPRIEADETWAFCGAKQRNATQAGQRDLRTFTAVCADTKLMVSWLVGARSIDSAKAFMADVAERMANRMRLTPEGHHLCLSAVEQAFGWNGVEYAQVAKRYGVPVD